MKIAITVQTPSDPEGIDLEFEVPIPDKHFKILKESGRLAFTITGAIERIKGELENEDNT